MAAAKSKPAKPAPEEQDPRFVAMSRIFAGDKRVTAGKLFASAGLKVDGKIFAMIVKGRLVVKLPRARVDALLETGEAERFDPGHGRLMKEWAAYLGPDAKWAALVREARAFVGGA
jgi:TfoX/Sxy family transcriptional regulator of competence genes